MASCNRYWCFQLCPMLELFPIALRRPIVTRISRGRLVAAYINQKWNGNVTMTFNAFVYRVSLSFSSQRIYYPSSRHSEFSFQPLELQV